jgi:uncharacterized protein
MRTDLNHLPPNRRRELERIVEMIFEEFEDAFSLARHEWKTRGSILKIVLYGSFARGDWNYEPETKVGRTSDYDLLIVVSDDRLTDRTAYWSKLIERFRIEHSVRHTILSPVQFFVHSLAQVNDALSHGRYFFIDVLRDGILLHSADGGDFAKPREKSPWEAVRTAEEYWREWLPSAKEFYDDFEANLDRGRFKKAAFELHQCVERLYHTIMLVRTFYTPYVHDLATLREQAELTDPRLIAAWPREAVEDIRTFDKLQQAYVNGRYPRRLEIGAAQLQWLGDRAKALIGLVEASCAERIADLRRSAGEGDPTK